MWMHGNLNGGRHGTISFRKGRVLQKEKRIGTLKKINRRIHRVITLITGRNNSKCLHMPHRTVPVKMTVGNLVR